MARELAIQSAFGIDTSPPRPVVMTDFKSGTASCMSCTLCTQQSCIWTNNHTWEKFSNVLFFIEAETPSLVKEFLINTNNRLVSLDDRLLEVMNNGNLENAICVSPAVVLDCLRKNTRLFGKELFNEIILYVLKEPTTDKIRNLMNCKIFYMKDGSVSALALSNSKNKQRFYFANTLESDILHSIKDRLIDSSSNWITSQSQKLFHELTNIAPLTARNLVQELSNGTISHETMPSLWKYIQHSSETLATFETLPILPVYDKNFSTKFIQLKRGAFSAEFFVKHDGIAKILSKLGLLFVNPRESFVAHSELTN